MKHAENASSAPEAFAIATSKDATCAKRTCASSAGMSMRPILNTRETPETLEPDLSVIVSCRFSGIQVNRSDGNALDPG